MKRLVRDVSAASENPKELGAVFDAMWPQLDAAVMKAIDAAPADTEPRRSSEDMLKELVERIRRIDRMTGGEEPRPIFRPTGPLVFTKDYVELDSGKTYKQGTTGQVTHIRTDPLDEITHIDVRSADGDFLRNVPIEYFQA
jgi:hypothetical protein